MSAEAKLQRIFARLLPFNIAVQAASFAAWVAFAHVLGATSSTDAYLLGLCVPAVVYGILLAAVNIGAIPGLTEETAKGEAAGARAANDLVSATLAAAAVLTLAVTALAVAAAPLVFGSDESLLSETRLIILELSPLGVLGALTGVLGALLAVRRSFIPAVAVMAFDPLLRVLLVVAAGDSLGVQSLVLANLLGATASVAVLWMLVRRAGYRLAPVRPARTRFVRSVAGVSVPLLISASVLQVNPLIDRTMAGSLGAGSVTVLELGWRLVPTGLFIALVFSPLVATWAARKASGGWSALEESVQRALSTAVLVVPPFVAIGILLRDQLVTFAYHGGAYSQEQASETSAVFAMYMLGLPAEAFSVIFATLFVVQRETLVSMKIGFLNVVLNIGLNLALRPLFGVAGIALSTSLTLSILNVVQSGAARRRWGNSVAWPPLRVVVGMAGALVVSTAVAHAVLERMPEADTRFEALLVAAVVGCVGLSTYAGVLLGGRRLVARAPRSLRLRFGLGT